MAASRLIYEELLAKIEALDPLIVEAIGDCDEAMLEELEGLSIDEKIGRASGVAEALSAFRRP